MEPRTHWIYVATPDIAVVDATRCCSCFAFSGTGTAFAAKDIALELDACICLLAGAIAGAAAGSSNHMIGPVFARLSAP